MRYRRASIASTANMLGIRSTRSFRLLQTISPGLENPTLTPTAGDLCFFWFKGADLGSGGYGFTPDLLPESGSGFIAELSLHYARNNLLLSPDSGWVPGNLFGTVVEGLEEIAKGGEDCWLNGVADEKLTFHRI